MITKYARTLQPGDRVIIDAAGETVTVTKVGRGFARGTVIIEWRDGWTCEDGGTEIVIEVKQ